MESKEVTNRDLLMQMKDSDLVIKYDAFNMDTLYSFVVKQWKCKNINSDHEKLLKQKIKNFLQRLSDKWNSVRMFQI